MRRKIERMGVLLILLLGSGLGHAGSFSKTPEEVAFCKASVPAEPHMHHYCDCLRFMIRASRVSSGSNEYRYNVGQAIDGCTYVLARLSQDNQMRPRVHIDHGRALKMAGKVIEAENEFRRAISLNSREIRGFFELSTLLRASRPADALDVATLGLKHNPNSQSLQKLYLDLGGRKPFPDPFVVQKSEAVDKNSRGQAEVSGKLGEVKADDTQAPPDDAIDGGAADSANTASCRFCPPTEIQERWRESFGANPEGESK